MVALATTLTGVCGVLSLVCSMVKVSKEDEPVICELTSLCWPMATAATGEIQSILGAL